MIAQLSEQQANNDLKTTAKWLLIAFFLGWLALLVRVLLEGFAYVIGDPQIRSTNFFGLAAQTGIAFIWALAWVTAGFLFGFIFGIPKVIAATTSAINPATNTPSQNPAPKLKVNTNLEDISDWLTKVLVGATLTQIVKIPAAIGAAAQFMSAGETTQSVSFNAALLLYYSALGFLSGYILTRLFFARAFALADQGPSLSAEAAATLDSATVAFGQNGSTNAADPYLRKAALASDSVPITESLTGDQALRLAKGATLTGDIARALSASRLAIQKNPDDPQAQLTYAWSLHNSGSGLDAVLPIVEAAARKLTSNSDHAALASVYASLAYLWLYQPPPAGYQNALRAIAEFDSKTSAPDASVEINRACALGQKYAFLSVQNIDGANPDATSGDLRETRDAALAAVKKAIALDHTSATRLQQILWVSADPLDNDLSPFQGDQDFLALLPRPNAA